ncbi:Rieske 2Fe-2S domain-containing protein [Novosphingobium sp. FSY-8]|uniref:Rieske 2Fe-2S domain-containing protein n=1 Tax=Novosphingobium ovatum TaxID=1908523 RepID=A0ABW9XHQ4_9SPHN|nr:SRPBCC family protein [Novosphingobium ovatum]NBC38092.1 Rieske 2Fe-2S domain-containing protein [Novosphingobium ovatum]
MTELYEKYAAVAEKMLYYVENKTTDMASGTMQVPVKDYLDEGRWQEEMDRIFKRLPLMLAMTIEIPNVNDYKAMKVLGQPVIITRGKDGKARAFLNVCKHRAMLLTPEGKGNCKAFACPYHGWTYSNEGQLMGIAEASTFGDVDRSTLHMTELPCDEAVGLIFVSLTPGLAINAVEWLDGMYEDFAALKLDTWYYHKSREMKGANWKVAYDGYLEGYHFQAAHTNTVATRSPSNRATFEGFGPHIRVGYPQNSITRLHDLPREEWGLQENHGYDFIRMLFPNMSFFLAPEMGQLAQLFPGPKANENTTVMNYVFPQKPDSEEGLAKLDQMCDFFFDVVEEEDYGLGYKVQAGLEARAMQYQTFGRNEPGNQFFHKWLAYYLDTSGTTPKPVMKG